MTKFYGKIYLRFISHTHTHAPHTFFTPDSVQREHLF